MPEGPEVWILSKAINTYFTNKNTFSYGKHLFLQKEQEDWSFGLGGKVKINEETNGLEKLMTGDIIGKIESFDGAIMLGTDWMTASVEELEQRVNFILQKHGKKKLNVVLLDQKLIAGIGVAWGSEICFQARLNPAEPVQNQDLSLLVQTLVTKRQEIQVLYNSFLQKHHDIKAFIDEWFSNLYGVRQMDVYYKATSTKVSLNGRNWWVRN